MTQYETKDSGERATFDTGMVRDVTTGKPRFDLISPAELPYEQTMTYRHAMLMARGAEKYGDRNWEQAETAEEQARFRESAYRHFMQWYHGETDEDHASAVYFNVAGTEYVKWQMDQATPPTFTDEEWDAAYEKVTGKPVPKYLAKKYAPAPDNTSPSGLRDWVQRSRIGKVV